ncbi:asparagine synthase-related protein [Paenibacillus humicola]|uniref:asparagine synthase-related protein n=1 Tax=Paenibacillus humicola TaxID=3110540 RepID=UPI00237AB4B5|nr:asparagine synthase-related protein [Paenibacillus humicola]
MSVIAGILCHSEETVPAEDRIRLMNALQHYPADDERDWQGGPVFLGGRAQWITPESVHEQVPLYDENRGLAVAADAILDNRDELFERLGIEYNRRDRMTDSELIRSAYEKWGQEAPAYLIGDFAFVIWDERRRLLFGARDLLGNRTLYYRSDARRFAFCTAVNPLLELPGVKKALNEEWLAEFLAIPVILDTADVRSTVYRGIEQLPPAHAFAAADGKLTLRQYGSLTVPADKLRLKSNGEYEEAFRHVFREAVTSRLRTHRQVSASLSGGLDSGAVAAFAADPLRQQGKRLYAYSYIPAPGFTDWTSRRMAADESPYIDAVVRHIGNMEQSSLAFPGKDSFGEIDDLLGVMEAPYKFFENSFWIKGILEKAREDGAAVLLTGARGNFSISWGPAMDYYAGLLRKLRWIHLYRELKLYGRQMNIGRSRLLPEVFKLAFPFAALSFHAKREPDSPQLIHPDLAARTNVFAKLKGHDAGLDGVTFDEYAARDYQFEQFAVSNHQGTSITKFSLRYGVWERDPTGDPRVVRFCLSLPVSQYVQHGIDRSIVRRATAGMLPDEVRLNQRVRGVQGADWIYRMLPNWGAFMDELQTLCRDPAASHFLNVAQIKASMAKIGYSPKPKLAYDADARLLMRGLIVYRFLKRQF